MVDQRKDSGVGGLKSLYRQEVEGLCHQRRPLLRCWFQVLLCLVSVVLCFTLWSSSLWNTFSPPQYHHRFLNWTRGLELFPSDNATPTMAPTCSSYHEAYPRNYHFIMDNTEVCETRTPFLVLMVPVAPSNVAARDAIRQTWANNIIVRGEVVLTLFMLGFSGGEGFEQQQEKLKQENLQHHDLIQSDFMDTYLNLTIKTMVIMEWLATHCQTAPYAMKIDSDMFLNIDNLVTMLQMPEIPKENYLTGMLLWNIPVVRSNDSKWYVPEELYPDPYYPTYAQGMGYIFSNDLPEKFVAISKSINPFSVEDAYIGMCMKKLGLAPVPAPNPSQFKGFNQKYDRCEYSKIITYILSTSQELIDYWNDLFKPGTPC